MADEAGFAVLDRSLEAYCFFQRFLRVSGANQVEQSCPERLTRKDLCTPHVNRSSSEGLRGIYLNPLLPRAIVVVAQKYVRSHLVGHARVTTQPRLRCPRLDGALDDVPVLLFQRFACALGNLPAEFDGLAGFGITQVGTSEFALNEWRIEDVRAGVRQWGE